ncbi:MAG: ATP-binding protein [Syntrophobacteraceae bacterium]|nr:ATP-binding protein [Syntrophobacteraceae bacterium]
MRSKKQTGPGLSMLRIAMQALGLLLVIPTLVILYLFKDNLDSQKIEVLLFALMAGILGFFLLWRILWGFKKVLRGLEKVSTGDAEDINAEGEVSHLREMASIINALNRLTVEFRENGAQLEKLIQQFATLAEITDITAHVPDINELLRLVLRKAMASTHARIGSIGLVQEDGIGLDLVACEGWTPGFGEPIAAAGDMTGKVVETGIPLLVEDVEKCSFTKDRSGPDRYSTNSFLIMPLRTKMATIGVLSLSDKATGGTFHGQDQQFLAVLLGQMGYAVENARLLKQARDAASNLSKTVQIQESKLEEAQLKIHQSEKLSALGQLAGGVAHDFNNLLQAILGYAMLSISRCDHDPTLAYNLHQVRMAAEKAASLASQLLAFGRRQMLKPKNLDLNRVIEELLKMVERVIGEHINLRVIAGSNGIVRADPQQIEQVLMNLCVNARDAMPDGGDIIIETRDVQVGPSGHDTFTAVAPGHYVLMSVKDNGSGMDKEMLKRVFEPFFTTKEVGKGTGLGLSTVYGIVSQHNGHVDVKSEPGRGTEFRILLPISEDPSMEVAEEKDGQKGGSSRGFETVLIAEDDNMVRDLSAEILREAGYEVLGSKDGEEAIEMFESNMEKIALLLVDAIMPKKSGREVYERVRSLKPGLPVLLFTGYSTSEIFDLPSDDGKVKIIHKPVSPDTLLSEVRNAINAHDPHFLEPGA